MGRSPSTDNGARRRARAFRLSLGMACAAVAVSGCIDPATNESTETTLTPLVSPSFVTLAPSTSTTTPAAATTTTTTPPNVSGSTVATVAPVGSEVESGTGGTTATGDTSDDSEPAVSGGGSYTVAANDTVYGIARKYGISAQALADLNDWSDGTAHSIFPGDELEVPDGVTPSTSAGSSGSAVTTTTTKSATTTTVSASSGNTYVVEAGDYLSLIAQKTGTTVNAIVAANGWSDGVNHVIIAGQTIKLPG